MRRVADLASGGFGTAWGHHRSFSNRLGVNQEFGNGYNWQIAHLPWLEPQAGGTLVVVGHNHEGI